ncbi:hypothetical protein KY320_03790 [Candidatus Woesearchaeota archaeon]|nr:hypothetical protein [Candidatus Woesearchaeota archaeon]
MQYPIEIWREAQEAQRQSTDLSSLIGDELSQRVVLLNAISLWQIPIATHVPIYETSCFGVHRMILTHYPDEMISAMLWIAAISYYNRMPADHKMSLSGFVLTENDFLHAGPLLIKPVQDYLANTDLFAPISVDEFAQDHEIIIKLSHEFDFPHKVNNFCRWTLIQLGGYRLNPDKIIEYAEKEKKFADRDSCELFCITI